MRSLDTNVILRFLLGDVPKQAQEVDDLLATARPDSFAVADAVLFETAWVLSGPYFQLDRGSIGDMLLQIAAIPQIKCNRELIGTAVPLYISNPALSFIDISLAVYAQLDDALPLLTYDRRLAKELPELTRLITDNT